MKPKQGDFDNIWGDLNGITAKEWREISGIARELKEDGLFKGDLLKCFVAAFVFWFDMQVAAEDLANNPDIH